MLLNSEQSICLSHKWHNLTIINNIKELQSFKNTLEDIVFTGLRLRHPKRQK